MGKPVLIPMMLLLLVSSAAAGEARDFGPGGMKGLSAEQEGDLADGKIVFSTTDSKGKAKNALIEAAVVFDRPPEYVWELLYRTEDQVKYLEEVDGIKVVEKEALEDVPHWVEALFKKRGVEKSLIAVRKYVDSGGTYRK